MFQDAYILGVRLFRIFDCSCLNQVSSPEISSFCCYHFQLQKDNFYLGCQSMSACHSDRLADPAMISVTCMIFDSMGSDNELSFIVSF